MDWFADLGSLNFVRPGALWLLALAAPVLLVHLLRTRPRRHVVPDIELWEEFLAQVEGTRTLQAIEDLLALLARIAIVVACALAAAGAFLGSLAEAPPGATVAVVLDTSPSMAAADVPGYRDRLAAARALAVDLLRHRLQPADEVVLLTTGGMVVGQGVDETARLAALHGASVDPTQVHRLERTVSVAHTLIGDAAIPRVIVLGDGGGPGALERAREIAPDLIFVSVGTSASNLALLDLELLPRDEETGAHRLQVRVANFGAAEASASLHGAADEAISLTLPPRSERVLQVEAPAIRTALALRIVSEPPDPYGRDDMAFAGLVPHPPAQVIVATERQEDVTWVAAALGSLGGRIDRAHAAQTSVARLADLELGDDLPDALICLGGTLPESAPPISTLLFGADAPSLGVERIGWLDAPVPWRLDETHPLLAGVSLAELAIRRALALQLDGRYEALATEATGYPLVAVGYPSAPRTIAVVASPLDESNLGNLASFPLLVRNAIDLFQEREAATVEGIYKTGETIRSRRPVEAARPVTVELMTTLDAGAPSRRLAPTPVVDGGLEFSATEQPGLYAFDLEGRPRYAGVNAPPDTLESDLAATPGTGTLADVLDGVSRAEPRRPLRDAMLWLAVAAFALDALLFALGRSRRPAD